MLEPRNFGVWVWWFYFPVRLEETHFATLVRQTGLQKDDCPWKWGSVRRHKLGFWGYIQVHRRAGIPLVLSSHGDYSCSAIFSRCLKLWLLYTLSDKISAVWHLGTEVTGVPFVTWSPWHIWTIAPWIRFCFLWLNHCCITIFCNPLPLPPYCNGSVA